MRSFRPLVILLTLRIAPMLPAGLPQTPEPQTPGSPASQLRLSGPRLELSIDFGLEDGHCRIRDRKTEEVYEAADFGVLRVWDATEDRARVLLLSPDSKTSTCSLSIERKGETSATIHVDTGDGSSSPMQPLSFGIAFDIEIRIEENTLEYGIPIKSIREENPDDPIPPRWRLLDVELFPLLGATPAGKPGYLVLPSWSGALYYFNRRHPRANPALAKADSGDLGTEAGIRLRWGARPDSPAEYGSMVYGEQAAWEDQLQLPIYGTIREKGGLMGILLAGEHSTELRARRDQGPRRTASVNPVFRYRQLWHSPLDRVDRRVRLIALDGSEASYSAMGNLYRGFLLEERGVKTLRERSGVQPEVAYFLDSIYVSVMMGMKEAALDGSGRMRSYQSWEDVIRGVDLFREAGFEKVNFIIVGGNFEGHDGAHPTVFPIEDAHGGEEDLKRLIEKVEEAGYRATFHLNYKDCYRCSPDWDPAFIQVNEFGELRYHGAWIGGYSYQGIPQEMLEKFGKRDLPRLRRLGLRGLHYWDACLSVLEETFPPGRVITRREYAEGVIAYFRYAEEIFGAVGCETSIAPLLGIVTNVGNTSMPHGGASRKFASNGYCEAGLLDHWVPLQHIVYHGLCCYFGGPEVAGRPGGSFWEPPTRAKVDELRERYLVQKKWNGKLDLEFITGHEEVARGVFRTTLSDGTRIWVNKSGEAWEGPQLSVPAGAHRVLRAGW